MDDLIKITIQYGIFPVIIGLGVWIMKSMIFNRLDKIEEDLDKKIDRQTLSDKLDPIKDDVADIKHQLNMIYQLLLKKD